MSTKDCSAVLLLASDGSWLETPKTKVEGTPSLSEGNVSRFVN
jgi:hypothetical protein